MSRAQLPLPFSSIRNSELFSNHWLEDRLPLEPEWTARADDAAAALDRLTDLWKTERGRVERYGKEAPLERAFIQPVFEALGWKLIYQCALRGRKPDYALFDSDARMDAALSITDAIEEFWQEPTILADAKAWDIPLDRPTITRQQREYPPEQIDWYLTHSRLDYAILTNGRVWRLIPRNLDPGQRRFQTYLECDLARLLKQRAELPPQLPKSGEVFADFLRFYLFFSPAGFSRAGQEPSLVERARKGSNLYRVGVGEDLKDRVFEALALCIEGFLAHPANNLDPARDIEVIREQSLTLLYRLLFILFAEDRQLLPYRVNNAYTANRSLGRFRDDIGARRDRIAAGRDHESPCDQVAYWPDLISLFDLIDSGRKSYGVPAYNGGLFDAEQHPFLVEKAIPDRWLGRVIDQLSRAKDLTNPERGLFRVDYRDLAIQHLGNVYEGLLELRPYYATREMVVLRNRRSQRKEERVEPADSPLPDGFEATGKSYGTGQVYLLTDKGERRASGSYYTPNHIVDYIVEKTLGPLCERIAGQLHAELTAAEEDFRRLRGENRAAAQQRCEALRGDFDDRVLRLRVVDPAMGSGHFLIRACQYLAEQIATHPYARDPAADELTADDSVIVYWKRKIAESCLYGVDRNAMAVELAKLALWLETVAVNHPLTFLDHHLRFGDSLIGAAVDDLGAAPGASALWSGFVEQQIKQRLPSLLETLAMIRRIPSDSVEQVKEKDKLYHKSFEPVRKPFIQVADAWISAFFVPPGQRIGPEQYKALVDALDKPAEFKSLLESPPFPEALRAVGPRGVAAFHWQLEFPEVFFGEAGVRTDAGFDAVIGNPPYDVLSEKETGRDLSAMQRFIGATPVYEPSQVDKNNLYKLFICRALSSLSRLGRMGFITPMAVLGDRQASGIRREILRVGAFEAIEAFPQKDDPERRVFRDAKLATVILIIRRSDREADRQRSIASRTHPANVIEPDSQTLLLTNESLSQYDPENLTVVSCSQVDWDLAVKIATNRRVERLGKLATSFQGEVNETNDRQRGRISYDSNDGPEVMRGAHLCLYCFREPSQGTAVYVRVAEFTVGAREDSKATHHKYRRVGFQRKSPQNNFRRLIASPVARESFLLESVSYVPEHLCSVPLEVVTAVLNSKLADWFFRLGSTNAMVAEYQFNILPCPPFADRLTSADETMKREALALLANGQFDAVVSALARGMASPPFSPAVQAVIVDSVQRIMAIEQNRGEIARSQRSALDPAAQPYQDLIDRLFYKMAGLTDAEAAGLESRLARML